MIHDHLCPHVQVENQRDYVACQCNLIAKVREDACPRGEAMIHDHLCPHVQVENQRDHVACQCNLIAKVREDAELAAWQDVYEKIHDGFRGNGSEDWNICCQLCQEIQCDGDCPVGEARRREREAAKQAFAVAVQRVEALRGWLLQDWSR